MSGSAPVAQAQPHAAPAAQTLTLASFEEVILKADANREIGLKTQLEDFVHLVQFEPGRIEFRPADNAPSDLSGRLASKLQEWTNARWVVTVSNAQGAPTISQQKAAEEKRRQDDVSKDPLVAAFFKTFPDAHIVAIRDNHVEEDESILDFDDDLDLEDDVL